METRLNKFLSDSGMCSRREADRMIEAGKVTINRKKATNGDKVKRGDEVRVNGNIVDYQADAVYIALNKPVGIVCTTDTTEPDNIIRFVNFPMRIFNIGRLDKMSEGLILLTNDGNIVNKILRAENNHSKEYQVVVDKPLTEQFLKKMSGGVSILGVNTKKCEVEQIGTNAFRIVLTQGLNRQIRRMCEALGYEVARLQRTRIMNIELGRNLPVGQWRMLEDDEVAVLQKAVEGSRGTAPVGLRSKKPRKKIFFNGANSGGQGEKEGGKKNGTGSAKKRTATTKRTAKKTAAKGSKRYTPKKQH